MIQLAAVNDHAGRSRLQRSATFHRTSGSVPRGPQCRHALGGNIDHAVGGDRRRNPVAGDFVRPQLLAGGRLVGRDLRGRLQQDHVLLRGAAAHHDRRRPTRLARPSDPPAAFAGRLVDAGGKRIALALDLRDHDVADHDRRRRHAHVVAGLRKIVGQAAKPFQVPVEVEADQIVRRVEGDKSVCRRWPAWARRWRC